MTGAPGNSPLSSRLKRQPAPWTWLFQSIAMVDICYFQSCSEELSVSRQRVSGFPEKGADLWGGLGNFRGSPGNFRGSLGNFRVTSGLLLNQGRKNSININFLAPDFLRTFLTLTPECPGVKRFLPTTGAAGKRTFWCGRPRFSARTSMTRRAVEKLSTKKVCVDFLAPIKVHSERRSGEVAGKLPGKFGGSLTPSDRPKKSVSNIQIER